MFLPLKSRASSSCFWISLARNNLAERLEQIFQVVYHSLQITQYICRLTCPHFSPSLLHFWLRTWAKGFGNSKEKQKNTLALQSTCKCPYQVRARGWLSWEAASTCAECRMQQMQWGTFNAGWFAHWNEVFPGLSGFLPQCKCTDLFLLKIHCPSSPDWDTGWEVGA